MHPNATVQVVLALAALLAGSVIGERPLRKTREKFEPFLHKVLVVLAVALAISMVAARMSAFERWVDGIQAVAAWVILVACCCCVATLAFAVRLIARRDRTGVGLQTAILSLLPIPIFIIAELLGRFFPPAG